MRSIAAYQVVALAALFVVEIPCFAGRQASESNDSRWSVRNEGSVRHSDFDKPDCHSLEYFETPKNAAYYSDVDGSKAVDDTVRSMRIGEIHGFAIHTIIINFEFSESSSHNPTYVKMIVVERKPGEFCKIYDDSDDSSVMDAVGAANVIDIASETLLASKDRVSGNGGISKEEYWTFDEDGPIFLDHSRLVHETLQKLLHEGSYVPKESASFDINTLSFNSYVECPGCTSNGKISIQFAIRNHRLVIISQQYDAAEVRKVPPTR